MNDDRGDAESTATVCAIVVAAGKGTRMASSERKQFMDIAGVPMLARTLRVFQDQPSVSSVVLVTAEDDTDRCKKEIVERYGLSKVASIVPGGSVRQESVAAGLKAAGGEHGIVMIHDGARPFVTGEQIDECIAAAREYGASCLAAPVTDTVKISRDGGFFEGETDRSVLWAVQTPQTFRRSVIAEAYAKASEDGFTATDDTALVSRLGVKVRIVRGGTANFKVTTPQDIELARAYAEAMTRTFK